MRGVCCKDAADSLFADTLFSMKITGITAEYNPLHNGHIWHLEQARELTGCDAVAVAMSGDFVQRGEAAVADKWTRAELALRSGADLVVEIPALFCLGNAFQYSAASVAILEALGCSRIAFGSESGELETIVRVAGVLRDHHDEIAEGISSLVREGKSYPAARAEVYWRIRSSSDDAADIDAELAVMSNPNDILALEYILNMRRAEPAAIKRRGAGHDSHAEEEKGLRSASALRSMIMAGEDISAYVPECTAEAFRGPVPDAGAECAKLLRYAVMSSSPELTDDCPSGGEGLGFLLKDAVKQYSSLDDIIKTVKSKRYTYSRISRLCMQLILGITREKYPYTEPSYIRVLGFNDKGREILSAHKHREDAEIPLITNINKEAGGLDADSLRLLGLDVHAADIFNLIRGDDVSARSDHKMKPVML